MVRATGTHGRTVQGLSRSNSKYASMQLTAPGQPSQATAPTPADTMRLSGDACTGECAAVKPKHYVYNVYNQHSTPNRRQLNVKSPQQRCWLGSKGYTLLRKPCMLLRLPLHITAVEMLQVGTQAEAAVEHKGQGRKAKTASTTVDCGCWGGRGAGQGADAEWARQQWPRPPAPACSKGV